MENGMYAIKVSDDKIEGCHMDEDVCLFDRLNRATDNRIKDAQSKKDRQVREAYARLMAENERIQIENEKERKFRGNLFKYFTKILIPVSVECVILLLNHFHLVDYKVTVAITLLVICVIAFLFGSLHHYIKNRKG